MEAPLERLSEIKDRMGLNGITNDLDGLKAFYKAWCLNVPFDNLRKTKILFGQPDAPLAPVDASMFFDQWLEFGIGGTCWQHSDAIYTLATALGFNAKRAAGSMYDMADINHGTVIVHLPDGSQWIVDNALLTLEPLRIDAHAPTLLDDKVHYAEVEIDGDLVFVHGTHPPMPWIFFRLRARDMAHGDYVAQWEELGHTGPFNSGLHIRRNWPDRSLTIRGGTLITLDKDGKTVEQLDGETVKRHLKETFGIAPGFVKEWAASGALEASLKPSDSKPPTFPERIPPSRRK